MGQEFKIKNALKIGNTTPIFGISDSSNFTNDSSNLATINAIKSYVDIHSGGTTTIPEFLNGLTEDSSKVYIGGDLIYNTTLNVDVSDCFNPNLGTGFNSIIKSIYVQTNNKILVGGAFTTLNDKPTSNGFSKLNSYGELDVSFNNNLGTGFVGTINLINILSDSAIIIGGNMSSFDGSTIANGLTILNSDGTLDASFNENLGTGFNGDVKALYVQNDDKILVGGAFTTLDGTTGIPSRLLRLNSDGTLDASFNENLGTGFNGNINSIYKISDNIFLAGSFTTFDGSTIANCLTKLSSDGTLDASFNENLGTGFNSEVYSIYIQSDNKILVGGTFTAFDGSTSAPDRLFRLNSDGTPDASFNENLGTGFNNTIYFITGFNNDILIGGAFITLNGNTVSSRFIKLDSSGNISANTKTKLIIEGNGLYYNSPNVIDNSLWIPHKNYVDSKFEHIDSSYIDLLEIPSPSNPLSNYARLYAKDSSGTTKLFFKDSSGNDSELGAGSYTLPIASDSTLGGVKIGTDLSILNGVLSLNLPIATDATLGGIKIGNGLSIIDGVLSLNLPIATESILGGIKAGNGLVIDSSGLLSSIINVNNYLELSEISSPDNPSDNYVKLYAKDSSGTTKMFFKDSVGTETEIGNGGGGSSYILPIASDSTLGGVKIGSGISIDSSGVISSILNITSYIDLPEISTPSDPSTNYARLYAKDSSGITNLFFKDSSSIITQMDLFAVDTSTNDVKLKNANQNLTLSTIEMETDGGSLILANMPISNPSNGEQSYSLLIDSSSVLRIYGDASGTVLTELAVIIDGNYLCIGDPNTNGSYRFISIDGSLYTQKKVTGTWVNYSGGTSSQSYVDGSLAIRDTSLGNLSNWEVVQDSSLVNLRNYIDSSLSLRDASITKLFNQNSTQDSSLVNLRSYIDASIDVKSSISYVDGSLAIRDTSLGNLTNWEITQDLSINNIRTQFDIIENSLGYASFLKIENGIINASTGGYNVTFDNSIGSNLNGLGYILTLSCYDSNGVVGYIISNRSQSGFTITPDVDASVEYCAILIDSSASVFIDNVYIRKSGDSMSGPLIIDSSLTVNGNIINSEFERALRISKIYAFNNL